MEKLKDELQKYIDNLSEYQLRILLGFIKELFGPKD